MNYTGKKIVANGITFNVIVEGEGPDVLLLHGFPDSSHLWRNQLPALVKAGYRVIVPDLRGSGASDAPSRVGAYGLDTLVKDVIGIMDHLGVKRTKLIGHDWGAVLGWHVTIAHPERIERYVAISVGHPVSYALGGFGQKLRGWYALFFLLPFIPEIVLRAFDWQGMRLLTGHHREIDDWIRDKSRPGRLTAAINWYRANLFRLLFGRPGHARVPVFGIWSNGDDVYLTEQQMKKSESYVDAPWRYERLGNSSHWSPLDVPERLTPLLVEYLGTPGDKLGK